ncbi:MAG TPA: RNA polymerase sigma factor [Ktedonosporobacter sp.]|nr:RNA polymerase sigma factor [Ktedonosporobacter sp.]
MLEMDALKIDEERSDRSGNLIMLDREQLFAGARPRLLRLARLRGVAPDGLEDVVQETLLLAWRLLDRLQTPEHFQRWVEEICRNVCYRYLRTSHRDTAWHIPLFTLPLFDGSDDVEEMLMGGNTATEFLDPAEILSQAEVTTLLRQALNLLPENTREVVELYYLLEVPQREAAVRLGLSISALETRLHRARHQLRQILNGDLRTEAAAMGLPLDNEPATGWRATSLWCYYCGRQHLHGTFETSPDGLRSLRMRCPECSRYAGFDTVNGKGLVALERVSSFVPAFKRTMQGVSSYLMQAVTHGSTACRNCGQVVPVGVGSPKASLGASPDHIIQRQFWVSSICPACGEKVAGYSADDVVFWSSPVVLQFIQQHPRWLNEPDVPIEYQDQPAILFRLSDRMSSARLDVIAHRETLRILASFQEYTYPS